MGLALERLVFRHLGPGSGLAKLVVAIGLAVALPSIFQLLVGFEPVAGRTPTGIVPDGATVFYDPFGVYAFSRNELVAMGIALAATVGLAQWQQAATGGGGAQVLFSTVLTGSFVSILPLVVAFLFLQRFWQSGLSAGGVKG